MEKLDKNTIQRLTRLCRIDCTEEEQNHLLKDLKRILDYMEQLQEINTDNVKPCSQIVEGIVNVMREDEVGDLLDQQVFLANAPSHIGQMIRIPPVIKSS